MHRVGDLYWVPSEYRDRLGPTMILLEISNGSGKFWTQGRKIIWDHLTLTIKVNYNLPKYHKGDPDYWEKLNKKLDDRGIGVV